ncbi:MAG TPA: glycosyltransferase [bacterium]|nr:glycosyltransferase [bacterium]
MTRILMLAPTPFFSDRGCHVRIYEEARYLESRGHDVVILTYPLGSDPDGLKVLRARAVSRYRRTEAGPAWGRLYLDALVLAKAWGVAREFRPDLIHAHLHEGALIGRILAARFKAPLLFDYQGSLTRESVDHGFIRERGIMARAFRAVEGWIDRGADRVVVSAGALAGPLAARGIEATAVPDGVDPARFAPGPGEPGLSRELGLPAQTPVALYLGVLSGYQGTDLILKAARLLRDQGERVHFLVMGYPEAQFKAEAERAGLADCVTFTGRVDYFEAARYLRLGTVALAPKLSRTEGNGKLLLYMACGLPVAAFDLPVNREIMGDAAEWVEAGPDRDECARGLARAVARLLHDRERAAELAAAGRRRVEAEFSMEAAGRRLLAVYAELLEARK